MYDEQSVLNKFNGLGILYEYHAHRAVFTVDHANEFGPKIEGPHCKNLFVKNKNGEMWILTIPDNKRADLKLIAEKLGSPRFSFCSADEMVEYLGVNPGSATPLAIANNSQNNVSLVVDKSLVDNGIIHCHPMVNTATISIKFDDMVRFIEHSGHTVSVMDLC